MKKLLYTTAFVLCGGIVQANAACIATPSCDSLGYTSSTACEGGLKCPFGEAWNCSNTAEDIKVLCEYAGYIYACTGQSYIGGAGSTCNGKYAKCTCNYGLEWKDGEGCVDITDCRLGSILYSDKTCSMSGYEAIAGTKTPIAIVVYKDDNGGQALSLYRKGNFQWGYGTDIPTLPNYSSAAEASKDLESCENTAKIIAAGNKSKYPAAWAAYEYSTEGTSAGDWCLPAAGVFTSYYNNKEVIDAGLDKVGGEKITISNLIWSSSEINSSEAWTTYFSYEYGLNKSLKYNFPVRPVLEF